MLEMLSVRGSRACYVLLDSYLFRASCALPWTYPGQSIGVMRELHVGVGSRRQAELPPHPQRVAGCVWYVCSRSLSLGDLCFGALNT